MVNLNQIMWNNNNRSWLRMTAWTDFRRSHSHLWILNPSNLGRHTRMKYSVRTREKNHSKVWIMNTHFPDCLIFRAIHCSQPKWPTQQALTWTSKNKMEWEDAVRGTVIVALAASSLLKRAQLCNFRTLERPLVFWTWNLHVVRDHGGSSWAPMGEINLEYSQIVPPVGCITIGLAGFLGDE